MNIWMNRFMTVFYRHCAETHCSCYRTDKTFSEAELRAQLSLNGQVVLFSEQDATKKGIPPSLVSIMKYAGGMNTENEQPGLEGTWDCSVAYPFNQESAEENRFYDWCLKMCIEAQPNDR